MNFNHSRLVPVVEDQTTQQEQPMGDPSVAFDPSRLIAVGKVSKQDYKALEDPSVLKVGAQEAVLNLADFFLPDEFIRTVRTGEVLGRQQAGFGDIFVEPEEVAKDREMMAEKMGLDYRDVGELPSRAERAAAVAVGGLGDPTTYIGGGPVRAGLTSLAPTAGGQLASEFAVELAQEADAGQLGIGVAGLAGGLLGGGTVGTAQAPVAYGFKTAGRAMTGVKHRIANRDEVVSDLAGTQVSFITKDALQSQSDLLHKIETAGRMAERLGKPSMKIGQIAALVANDHFQRDFREFYMTNDNFSKMVDDAVAEYNKTVLEFKKEFGGGTAAQMRQLEKAVAREQELVNKGKQTQDDTLQARIFKLEDNISEVSQKIYAEGDTVEAGKKLQFLQQAQESAAKERLGLEYDDVLQKAINRGMHMSGTSVRNLYMTNKAKQLEELFGKGNRVSTAINKHFAPELVKQEDGTKVRVFNPVGIEQVDSLKREINGMLRDKLDYSQYSTLTEVKKTLDTELQVMDPDFAAAYKAADQRYWEEVGVPFNQAGVAAISRAKFAKDVSSKVMNPEVARQYLAMAGDEGVGVLEHAIRVQLSDKLFKDGEFQPKAYKNWMDKSNNRALLELVPNLKGELSTTNSTVMSLLNDISEMEGLRLANQHHQSDELFRGLGTNLDKVTREILTNTQKRESYIKSLNNVSPENREIMQNGIRSAMLEQAMAKANADGSSIMDFIKDKQHRTAFVRMFGKDYIKDLEALAYIGDSVAGMRLEDLPKIKGRKEREFGQESIGMTPSSATALIRRPIVSRFQKVMIATSLISTKQVANARDSQLMQIMANPQLVRDVVGSFDVKDGVVTFKKEAGNIITTIALSAGRGAYFGARDAHTGEGGQE